MVRRSTCACTPAYTHLPGVTSIRPNSSPVRLPPQPRVRKCGAADPDTFSILGLWVAGGRERRSKGVAQVFVGGERVRPKLLRT